MPDFDDAEKEAKDHGKLIDEGVAEVEEEADKAAGGKDHGLIDKATQGVENEVGGSGSDHSGQ